MGSSKTVIMDGEIADEMGDSALPGFRSEFLNRRSFLFGSAVSLGALGLAGCATTDDMARARSSTARARQEIRDTRVDVSKIDPKYYRRTVRYDTREAPGTIIIDPANYYVYRVEDDGNATRYGAMSPVRASCGPARLTSGAGGMGTWTRQGDDPAPARGAQYAGGMPGGLGNPLGARTLYLYQKGVYTVCTIYSTSDPTRSGPALRAAAPALTQDMLDLYSRTPIKTKVILLRA